MRKDSRSEGKLMEVNEIGGHESRQYCCGIDIKSKATFTKCRSYIGNGDG